ncbi:MAG: Crp/Fnr family transcriptional regulator [Ruminococcaceae bacterium]|nr:Crp/Fnr family transcriptional regulator [Oscillospiraceae bacterium]
MKKYFEILKKCPLFFGIAENDLLKMLPCLGAEIVKYDKRDTVFAEGSEAKNIGVLLSGGAESVRYDYYGNKSIINKIDPPEVFGEAFACAEAKSLPISIVAIDSSEIMLINCSHILHTCSNNCAFHQQMIYNLMKDLASKTVIFHQRIEVTSKRSTREKLLAYLGIVSQQKKSKSFKIPFNRQELADYLEVDRSGLSAEISKMRKEGILESERNYFKLL